MKSQKRTKMREKCPYTQMSVHTMDATATETSKRLASSTFDIDLEDVGRDGNDGTSGEDGGGETREGSRGGGSSRLDAGGSGGSLEEKDHS